MRLETIQIRIRELMSLFVTQVKGATAQGDSFLNVVAETVLVPLFKEVYELPNLKNLNQVEKKNFPAIDLADIPARVAFQVTSTATSDKVKDTLRTFTEHHLYERFDRLIIYILSEKQTRYSGSKYDDLTEGQFSFDKDRDIVDFQDILSIVSGFDAERAERVLKILENNINGSSNTKPDNLPLAAPIVGNEPVFLNLLSIDFPSNLYIAELAADRGETIRQSQQGIIKLTRDSPTRDVARAALEQRGLSFSLDWITHENKIITFHDLNQADLPLYQIIDPGTIETLPTSSFYSIDESYNRLFKDLLRRCLQQLLFHRNIQWQHGEKLFIFMRTDSDVRTEGWYGTSSPSRTVYECQRNSEDPEKIRRHIHFGFRTNFKQFDKLWYLAITPDWFVSYDGYEKSFYGADFIKYKKRKESNQHVNTHVRFVAHFLKHHHAGLFDGEEHAVYPFLSFGDFVHFDTAPLLDDDAFLPKPKKHRENDEYIQPELL
jgi:hypothetical protein